MASRSLVALSFLVLTCASACEGVIGGGAKGTPAEGPTLVPTNGAAGAGPATTDTGASSRSAFAHGVGLRRLTRVEYANTIRTLLGVEVERALQPKETLIDGHSQIGAAQKTGYEDAEAFYTLGEKAAEQASTALAAQLGCTDAACFKTWATTFLKQAFRGAVPDAAQARYLAIFDETEAGGTPMARLQTFIASVLSSPYFLYKQEIGQDPAAPVAKLIGTEIATRLSYLIWQDMPDAALLDAGASGALDDAAGRSAVLARLMQDSKAEQGLRGFVGDWMGLFENALTKKDAKLLAQTDPNFPDVAERSFDATVVQVLRTPSAHFSDLFLADSFSADATLAKILGVSAMPAALMSVPIPTDQRLGILTHPFVIGAHSKEGGASPFPIGKFIYQNVLCKDIPPPLPGIPSVSDDSSGQTLRQRLEALTKNQPCISCHSQIGPPGFAFLPFDPIGRYSANDGLNRPWDTAGALVLPSVAEPVPFADEPALSRVLAQQPDVALCIVKRLFRFNQGRFEGAADQSSLDSFGTAALQSGTEVKTLLEVMVTDDSFAQARVSQ